MYHIHSANICTCRFFRRIYGIYVIASDKYSTSSSNTGGHLRTTARARRGTGPALSSAGSSSGSSTRRSACVCPRGRRGRPSARPATDTAPPCSRRRPPGTCARSRPSSASPRRRRTGGSSAGRRRGRSSRRRSSSSSSATRSSWSPSAARTAALPHWIDTLEKQ